MTTAFGTFLSAWGLNLRPISGQTRLQVRLGFAGGAGLALEQTSGTPTQGVWHHAAFVLDRDFSSTLDSLSLFSDGVQVAQTTGDFPNIFYGTTPLYFGAGNYGTDPNGTGVFRRNFDGQLDEVRITAAALPSSQFLNASAAAPEPGTFALLALGAIGFVARRRK